MSTTVLITGANRGIGRGLAEAYLARPDHTVIAGVRSPSHSTALSLNSITPASGSRLVLVKLDSKSDTDADEAVATLKAAGISHLDVLIANAGVAGTYAKVDALELADTREYFEVNTLGPVKVFKALFPLLKEAKEAKFVGITTNVSSIQDLEEHAQYMLASYGASKAALNYLVRRAHVENEWLTAFVINPGFAQTDMGNSGARHFGMEKAWITVQESVDGVVKLVDNDGQATGGKFFNYDGSEAKY
ncbi:putative NADP(+)-dependent dehydrogenase [Bombardia bombarda]|uniref:NADP(+)-dependent dehydrogenase n=1 Tax=Bombardia bombarda TaxID=252184 RepID=A0AA39XPM3_9PEZI|nr:putative NADP(+)-dependent dehydrogenase [Bombardia bombarda]